ncbi:Hint domain-containing protein [Halocynthiibacter styelae]|uniref:Hint domain-containing protein n=1 Tax=Halocynthiibacter styelae TaxID=2761955 RepID=A0A8J7LQI9_9RHOB|nr:Hint domain-containing protein [Paenihalocynthiibacter styelae]MBI1494402.1 Hint domain-containing protein [Paenihalocynthiibacter styelae]
MPVIRTLYLGKLTVIDPVGAGATGPNENASSILGTYGNAGNPLAANAISVDVSGSNPALLGTDHNNNFLTSYIVKFDIGGGQVTKTVDAIQTYGMTVKFSGGTSQNLNLQIFQTTDGHTFLAVKDTLQQTFNKAVESVSLNSVPSTSVRTLGISQFDNFQFVCFAKGSAIQTPHGETYVEDLKSGDLVSTADSGDQDIIWIGNNTVIGNDKNSPYRIPRGYLNANRDLYLSPQHRVAIDTSDFSGNPEDPRAFLAIKHLALISPVVQVPVETVTYYHVLTKKHETLISNGVPTESFYPGPVALDLLPDVQRTVLEDCLTAHDLTLETYGDTALETLRRKTVLNWTRSTALCA